MICFSVVIPVYNRIEQLKNALNSLVSQTYDRFEVLVCDDGSTDDVFSAISQYKSLLDITYFKIDNSGSPAKPRNIGILHAKYDWIAFLDSDDIWYPHKLECISKVADLNCHVIYHRLVCLCESEQVVTRPIGNDICGDPLVYLLTRGNPIPNSAAVVRRDLLLEVGLIAEDSNLVEDYDLWIRLAKVNVSFKFIDKVLGEYWIGEDNISKSSIRSIQRLENVFKKNTADLPENDLPAALAYMNYSLGIISLDAGLYRSAMRHFLLSHCSCVLRIKFLFFFRFIQAFYLHFLNSVLRVKV